jgi:hypothetical protein
MAYLEPQIIIQFMSQERYIENAIIFLQIQMQEDLMLYYNFLGILF